MEYFKSELEETGEIIPTGPKAEKPQSLIKPIIDVSRPRDERRLSSDHQDAVESIIGGRRIDGGVSDGVSVSEVLVDVNEDRI